MPRMDAADAGAAEGANCMKDTGLASGLHAVNAVSWVLFGLLSDLTDSPCERIQCLMKTCRAGYELLAENYPKNVFVAGEKPKAH